MRTILAAVLAAQSLAGRAAAQEWYVQSNPDGYETEAIACLPGEFDQIATSLCLYVACEPDGAPGLGMGLQQVPLRRKTPVRVEVDGREVADLVLSVPAGLRGGTIPLGGREALLDELRTGRVARLSLGAVEGWRDYEVQLSGAREAIETALAACSGLASKPIAGDDPR
jgi:hypothetical protein